MTWTGKIRPSTLGRWLVLAIVLVWVLLPLYFLVAVALTPSGITLHGLSLPTRVTFENFASVLGGVNVIWPSLVNSVVVTVASTVLALVFAVPAAYALSHLQHRRLGRGLYMSAFVLRGVPPVALVLPYYILFSKTGLLNTITGVILALVPLALPYSIWTMRVFFDAVPPQVEEAAGVDGAGTIRTFFSVVLPVARPGMAATGILAALLVFVDYMVVTTLAGPATMTFPVYVTTFQQDYLSLVGPLAAASIVGALPMLLMFGFSQRYMLRLANVGVH